MIEILKKQWFVVLIAIILISFAVFSIWDTNKGKLPGKTADGKDVIAAVADQNIFADDVFENIKQQSADQYLYQKFQDAVADQAIETTDDIKSEAKLQAESIESNFKTNDPTNYKTTIQSQLAQVGYSDLNDYCLKSVKVQKLLTNYMDEHMDELFTPLHKEKNGRVVAHILIKMEDSANPTDEEKEKVKKVDDALASGKSFAEVAKEFSDDSSATAGGLIGYSDSDSQLVEEFKEKALSLKKDEVSDWVKVASTNYQGWHKIVVLETDKDAIVKYEDDNDTVKNQIYSAIMSANENLDKKIIWEKSKDLEVTYANDDIKKQLMDYMNIKEEESK